MKITEILAQEIAVKFLEVLEILFYVILFDSTRIRLKFLRENKTGLVEYCEIRTIVGAFLNFKGELNSFRAT